MKRLFLSAFLLPIIISLHSQQLPNNSFENWSGNNPDDWGTIDQAFVNAGWPSQSCVIQTTPAADGSYAVSVSSHDLSIGTWNTTIRGWIGGSSISIDTTDLSVHIVPFPINYRPDVFSFSYKFFPVSGDSATITCLMYKWNSTLNKRDTIGGFLAINRLPKAVFTSVNIPINYNTSDTPDSVELTIRSGNLSAHEGTSFIIDQIGLLPYLAGVEGNEDFQLQVYPNPAREYISIDQTGTEESIQSVEVIDIKGQITSLPWQNNSVWNIQSLSAGMYTLKIIFSNGAIRQLRFIKQ